MSFNKESFRGIKLLYICDTHNRFNNPIYRKGDFKDDINKKYQDIKQIISSEQVDVLLHGGDMFDTPFVKESTWIHYSKMLMQMEVPIYAIPGNHDMEAHNPITLPNTPIYYMAQLGILNLIETTNVDNPIIFKKNGISVQITGRGFHPSMDYSTSKKEDYLINTKNADYAVHMVHGNLLDKPIHELAHYTLVSEIKDTMADVTLAGHYHKGFPLTHISENGMDKYFYNPGGTVRKTKEEMKRMPKVVLIYLDDNGIHFEDRYLPSAKETHEVLDIDSIQSKKNNEEELKALIEDFKSRATESKAISVQEMLVSISEQKNVSDKVKETALNFITQAKDKLGGVKS